MSKKQKPCNYTPSKKTTLPQQEISTLISVTPSAWVSRMFVYVEQMVIIAALMPEHVCLDLHCPSLLFRFGRQRKHGLLMLCLSNLSSSSQSCPFMGLCTYAKQQRVGEFYVTQPLSVHCIKAWLWSLHSALKSLHSDNFTVLYKSAHLSIYNLYKHTVALESQNMDINYCASSNRTPCKQKQTNPAIKPIMSSQPQTLTQPLLVLALLRKSQ